MKIEIGTALTQYLEEMRDGDYKIQKQNPNSFLEDLTTVGPDKPLGYLPLDTIRKICGRDPEELKMELTKKGLTAFIATEEESNVHHGALYAYDSSSLTALLSQPEHQQILLAAGWPETADEFVRYSMAHHAQQKTPLFDLVADAYADWNNPLRKYITHVPDTVDRLKFENLMSR